MADEISDEDLLNGIIKGNILSYNELFKKFNKKVYWYAFSYLKNKEDAEGIVQEVFMTLWRKRADLKKQDKIDSYLFTVTFNAIRKRFRKLSREKKHLENYAQTIKIKEDSSSNDFENNNLHELLKQTINSLPPRQKTIYSLSNEEGCTLEEISQLLNISIKTVENHLHRAKTRIVKALKA
jgi:RNA polymerase sigma-70 factor (family 1)